MRSVNLLIGPTGSFMDIIHRITTAIMKCHERDIKVDKTGKIMGKITIT